MTRRALIWVTYSTRQLAGVSIPWGTFRNKVFEDLIIQIR